MKLTSLAFCIPLSAAVVMAAVVYGPPTVPPFDPYVHIEQHFAVSPPNRQLSLELMEHPNQSDLLQAPTPGDYTELKGDAFLCFGNADPAYRNFWKLQLGGRKILVVGDVVSDRGEYCFYYFTSRGQYLSSYCGGAGRHWVWHH